MARHLDSATRARRLLALLPHLHKGDSIPLAELAHAVGCSVEEVAADLTTLTMCGIPPFTPFEMVDLDIDGDVVSVYMDPPGLERPLKLTGAEARALNAALEVAGYASDSPLREKLRTVSSGAVSPEDLEHTVRAGAAPGGAAETYAKLASAIEEREMLRVAYYTGSTGRISERILHPWALVQRMGIWYLVAWCETAGQERVFRLDRMRAIEHTGVFFEPPAEVATAVTPDAGTLQTARIRFRDGALLPDARHWPGVTLQTAPDGVSVADVPFQSLGWIARRVVAYLGLAEVDSPSEVREAVRDLASSLLRQIK
ncbi:MAG: WYL domain-containing protein [Actinobacteria bacterium]|nr:WYL domain-containing protein [Actinomycetota bacterium]